MLVGDLMSVDPVTLEPDLPVGRALDLLTATHVHGAPVVDDKGALIGIVSQEDILVGGFGSVSAQDADAEARVRDIMTSPAMSVAPDATIEAVARMMWRFRIHHVPVVDGARVVGIVSALDFCRHIAGEDPGD